VSRADVQRSRAHPEPCQAGVPIGFRTALAPDEHRESRPVSSRIFLSDDSGAPQGRASRMLLCAKRSSLRGYPEAPAADEQQRGLCPAVQRKGLETTTPADRDGERDEVVEFMHRPHDYESCTGGEPRRNAVKLGQEFPGNGRISGTACRRGSPGVCARVDAWWSVRRFALSTDRKRARLSAD
jgi:hypothetical protein